MARSTRSLGALRLLSVKLHARHAAGSGQRQAVHSQRLGLDWMRGRSHLDVEAVLAARGLAVQVEAG